MTSILFIAPYPPSLIRVRPYNFIRSLSDRGHRITLLAIHDSGREVGTESVDSSCERVIRVPQPTIRSIVSCLEALPGRMPLQAAFAWNPALLPELERRLPASDWPTEFDVVHVEHLRGVRYGLQLRQQLAQRNGHLPVVWDSVDCISSLFEQTARFSTKALSRWIARWELPRTREFERWLLPQFEKVLVSSAFDRKELLQLAGGVDAQNGISVVPNGVDLDYFRPGEPGFRRRKTIVMTGKMSYHANVTMGMAFVNEIFPRVLDGDPSVELWIIGKDPPSSIRSLDSHPSIRVTGTVPDMREYLHQATLAVVPLKYGVGIQNKVLEAMATATPVVSTSKAVGALQVIKGQDVLIADTAEEFAAKILEALANPELQARLAQAGRKYVETHHNWAEAARQLEAIYEHVISE